MWINRPRRKGRKHDRPAGRLILHLDKDEPGKVRAYPLKHHERDFALFGYLLGAYNIMKTGVKS